MMVSLRKLLHAMWQRSPKACSYSPLFSQALMAELHAIASIWLQLFAMWLRASTAWAHSLPL